MSKTQKYDVALNWADLKNDTWKIVGQWSLPSDPSTAGSWVYFPQNASDSEIVSQRDRGNLITTITRIAGILCLLGKRPKRKNSFSDVLPAGYKHSASWM